MKSHGVMMGKCRLLAGLIDISFIEACATQLPGGTMPSPADPFVIYTRGMLLRSCKW